MADANTVVLSTDTVLTINQSKYFLTFGEFAILHGVCFLCKLCWYAVK